MRNTGTLFHSSPVSKIATPENTAAAAGKESFSPPATIQRSPWHSPVPYLFGGLAAMLGLIAFALLILACSYWKLSGQVNGGEDGGERDVEGGAGGKGENASDAKAAPAFEEKFLVIMAGDVKPTFLATPTTSRASSFNDENGTNSLERENEKKVTDHNQTEVRIHEIGETPQQSQLSQEQRIQIT